MNFTRNILELKSDIKELQFKVHYEEQGIKSSITTYVGPYNFETALFKRRRECITKLLPNGKGLALDVGCGVGIYSLDMIKKDFEVVAIDISSTYLKKAKKLVGKEFIKGHFIVCDAQKLPLRSSTFQLVLCSEVLEHLPNYLNCLVEISRVLTSQGILILSFPSVLSFTENFFRSEEHLHRINQFYLKKVLEASGFQTIKEKYCNFMIMPIRALFRKIRKTRETEELLVHFWRIFDELVGKMICIRLLSWCYILKLLKL